MNEHSNSQENPFPVDLGHAISIVIEHYKGYDDVEVHLFKPQWDKELEEALDWDEILGSPIRDESLADPVRSRKILLETFSSQENETVLNYLKSYYESRLNSLHTRIIGYPIPKDLIPLSYIPESENIGIIRFEDNPNYPLDFPVHGVYDLSKHK